MYRSRWKGSHYNAGLKYGSTLCKKGINPLENIQMNGERRVFTEKCIPLYQKYYPEILEEIKAVADGLCIEYKDMATFLFSIYCFTFENKCSCFAFYDNSIIVFGRNSDFSIDIEIFVTVLTIK